MVWNIFALPEDKFFSLPEDILIEILTRLPVKSLLCCKCVSKNWLRFINSSDFVRLHREHQSLNNPRILLASNSDGCTALRSLEYETCNLAVNYAIPLLPRNFYVVGSCNGLVCLSDYFTFMVLCNPATKEYVNVAFDLVDPADPDGCIHLVDQIHSINMGFGYDVLTDTYKVVRVVVTCNRDVPSDVDDCKVHVYTLGTKEWRRIPTPYRLSAKGSVPYLHGAFHWFCLAAASKWTDESRKVDSIIAFDVGSENFRKVPIVVFTEKSGAASFILKILQGCLSKYVYYFCEEKVDIWLMKDYGVKESWAKFVTIPLSVGFHLVEPLVVQKNGEILFKVDSCVLKGNIYTYDPENNSVNNYVNGISRWFSVYVYFEGLVSIASLSRGLQADEDTEKEP